MTAQPDIMDFRSIVDQVLKYHLEMCKAMHTNAEDPAVYRKMFNKAEAAREILVVLGNQLRDEDRNRFSENLRQRFLAQYEAMFFTRQVWDQPDKE